MRACNLSAWQPPHTAHFCCSGHSVICYENVKSFEAVTVNDTLQLVDTKWLIQPCVGIVNTMFCAPVVFIGAGELEHFICPWSD